MAKLITTQKEKDAVSFLDWDDAALGKMCKQIALILRRKRQKQFVKGKVDDNLDACINAADGMFLIGNMVEMNAATMNLKFGDFTHNGKPAGDWELIVRQLPVKKKDNS